MKIRQGNITFVLQWFQMSGPPSIPRESPVPRLLRQARAPQEHSVLLRFSGGIELLHGNYKRHSFELHWHDSFMLGGSLRGAERLRYKGSTQILSSDRLALFNPGEIHDGEAVDSSTGWEHCVLFIPMAEMRRWVDNPASSSISFERPFLHHPEGASTFFGLHDALVHAGSRLEEETLLTLGLRKLLTLASWAIPATVESDPGKLPLDRTREYLRAHWAEPLSLDDLVRISGLSKYHLLRSFRSFFGLSPHNYQTQLRVLHAKELLFSGAAASEVALVCGFYDQAHLTTTLRRYSGVTPRNIRKAASGSR